MRLKLIAVGFLIFLCYLAIELSSSHPFWRPGGNVLSTKATMQQVKLVLMRYYNKHNKPLSSLQEGVKLEVLEKHPLDSWSNKLLYLHNKECTALLSLGADNLHGGEEFNSDILLSWVNE